MESQQESIATTYAKALLASTEISGSTASVLGELDALAGDVLAAQPKFTAALASPRFSEEEKLGIIDRTFGGRVCAELLRFLKVIARRGRFSLLTQIAKSYRHQVNALAGREEVTVTTAQPLTDDLHARVVETLEARLKKPIDLRAVVDESLIGGMVVRVGDTVFDASVANRLNRMRKTAIKNTAARLQKA